MLVLDACRDTWFRDSRGGRAGLAPMEARGTLIAYATGAGQTASDNASEENGLFTSKFLEAIEVPGLTATELFRQVRREVYAASAEAQWPAVYDDLLSDFVFREATPPRADAAGTPSGDVPVVAVLEQENLFWESIADSGDVADFEAYLSQFPSGVYAPLARNRAAALRRAAEDAERLAAQAASRRPASRTGDGVPGLSELS